MRDNKKNIVLLGMMGAGKTSVGRKLAEKLSDYSLLDLDTEIEKSAQMKISEIFEKFGETRFRELETNCVKEFAALGGRIISTGGGIVCRTENLDLLRKKGVLFYLSAPAEVLYERVKEETHRPLLCNTNPLKVLEELLENREPAYKTADYEIETKNKNVDEIAKEIIEKYETGL